MATVDYYFSLLSPYAYLGHATLLDVVRETGATLHYRPVSMPDLFATNGGIPLAQRAPARQRYRLVELQRWRTHRDVPLNLAPKHFPVDATLADRCAIVLIESGQPVDAFVQSVFRALWVEDRDIADAAELAALLEATGANAAAVLATAREPAAADIHRRNTDDAIAADLPGLPGYVAEGETFWGQDRLAFLRNALAGAAAARDAD